MLTEWTNSTEVQLGRYIVGEEGRSVNGMWEARAPSSSIGGRVPIPHGGHGFLRFSQTPRSAEKPETRTSLGIVGRKSWA